MNSRERSMLVEKIKVILKISFLFKKCFIKFALILRRTVKIQHIYLLSQIFGLNLQSQNFKGTRKHIMANHKSALKRIRSNNAKRLRNRYQHKTTRTFIKKLTGTTDKTEAQELFKEVASMIDKLAKRNIIHKNKAANNKSRLAKFVNGLG